MYTHGRKAGARVSLDYTYRGMRVAYLENETVSIGVLVDKGADIFEFSYKPRNIDFMWQSPIPMRAPFIATRSTEEGRYHDYYYGGWQEVLPSGGSGHGAYLGSVQGLHGEVSLLPFEATIVEDTPERVSLRLTVRCYRSPLTLTRTMTLDRDHPVLTIEEQLTNESPNPFAVMWGHHPVVGEPFLDDSCVVQAAAKRLRVLDFHRNQRWEPGDAYQYPLARSRRGGDLADVTRVMSRKEMSVDLVNFSDLDAGWYGLTNRRLGLGFGMSWDAEIFREIFMWQSYGGHDDFPWFGRTYNCGIQPHTSWPPSGLANAAAAGSALELGPSQTIETTLTAVAYEADGISGISRSGSVIL